MTMSESERLLRSTFAAHENDVSGAAQLLPGARASARRRRRLTVLGAVAAVIVVAAGTVFAVNLGRGSAPSVAASPSDVPPGPTPGTGELPHDWVWRSSLGLEIGVPGGWVLNDFGCNMTDAPTFVSPGGGDGDQCLTPESPHKQVAAIAELASIAPLEGAGSVTTVDGVHAELFSGQLPDGRLAGQLRIPSRDIVLDVRTRDRPELDEILHSARLVDVDHLGCATQAAAMTPLGPSTSIISAAEPTQLRVCYYAAEDRLQLSVELDEAQALAVRTSLTSALPGRNADRPTTDCVQVHPPKPDAMLILLDAQGDSQRLWVTFSGCQNRGVDNGSVQVHVTQPLVHAMMGALSLPYGFSAPL